MNSSTDMPFNLADSQPSQQLAKAIHYLFQSVLGVEDEFLLAQVERLVEVEQQGHICLDLYSDSGSDLDRDLEPEGSAQNQDSALVAQLAQCLTKYPALPLVLDNGKLYFQRRFDALKIIATGITARTVSQALDSESFRDIVHTLFEVDAPKDNEPDWQLIACCVAASHHVSVISGGPGTGKTRTVTRLLSALLMLSEANHTPLAIQLAAPTGKAAARMLEAIRKAREDADIPAPIKAAIPDTAKTLHRLLGYHPQRGFRHHKNNPLALDILIIDEASMIDLELMAHVLEALPSHSQLILLGDKDQLASVEGGSLFADICDAGNTHGYSSRQVAFLESICQCSLEQYRNDQEPALADSIAVLKKTYRFDENSQIKQLADWANSQGARHPALLDTPLEGDVRLIGEADSETFRQTIIDGYRGYLEAIHHDEPIEVILDKFEQFRLLSATRERSLGVKKLNTLCEELLRHSRLISPGSASDKKETLNNRPATAAAKLWYEGRPVMITENNYHLGLYNGDIGICVAHPESGQLQVHFRLSDNQIKVLSPARVPGHETAYAMTIHKSQGSEFEHVLLVIQDVDPGLLTKELLYTGITRAKARLTLLSNSAILKEAISRRVQRHSGLREKLWQ